MSSQKTLSRKYFIRILTGLVFGLLIWIWYRLTSFQEVRETRSEFRHGQELPMGISYFDQYYLFRNETGVRAFSTTCTHAGCRIGKSTGATLQCNCHGSQFQAETGNPTKGPALKPLEEYECCFDQKNEQWVVRLKPLGI